MLIVIDIWSIGCIFAELLTGKVLFPGKDYVHQMDLIVGVLGTPKNETLDKIGRFAHPPQTFILPIIVFKKN